MGKKTYDSNEVVLNILDQEMHGAAMDGGYFQKIVESPVVGVANVPGGGISTQRYAFTLEQVEDSKTKENWDAMIEQAHWARMEHLKRLDDAVWADCVELFCQGYRPYELKCVSIMEGGYQIGYQLWVHHELYREYGVSLHS